MHALVETVHDYGAHYLQNPLLHPIGYCIIAFAAALVSYARTNEPSQLNITNSKVGLSARTDA